METKSPTTSVNSREIIGVDQFVQRREVFGKYETVFLPPLSDTINMSVYKEADPTSNHSMTMSNFKRNAPGYSSMRESREDYNLEFRARKYSDNFTSDLNQSSDSDYRQSMTERTRRLSKLRRDFLNSNLHEPTGVGLFARTGVRASMPATSVTAMKYKIESPNLYKFPFAEPYSTPPPLRRVVVDLGPAHVNGEKENQNPEPNAKSRHQSLPYDVPPKIDHQKLFEELVKRYSPQRKPVNWNLPPTRPRVVGSVPKSTTSMTDSVDSSDKKVLDETFNKFGEDDVFVTKENNMETIKDIEEEVTEGKQTSNKQGKFTETDNKEDTNQAELLEKGYERSSMGKSKDLDEENAESKQISYDGEDIITEIKPSNYQNNILETNKAELEEKKDQVPELSTIPKSEEDNKPLEKFTDISIPALIEKMTEEAEESPKKENKKVKRKRSFLDKLLGRKKGK